VNELDRLQVGPRYFGLAHERIGSDHSPSLSAASRFSRRHRFITPSFLSTSRPTFSKDFDTTRSRGRRFNKITYTELSRRSEVTREKRDAEEVEAGSGKRSANCGVGGEESGQGREGREREKGKRSEAATYLTFRVAKRLISGGTFSSALTTVQLGRTMVLSEAESPRESTSTILHPNAERFLTISTLRCRGRPFVRDVDLIATTSRVH